MYAIIQDGAHQYKVQTGDRIWVAHRALAPGATLVFDRVLACGGEGGARIGTPRVPGAQVVAEVVGTVKAPKVVTHHYRRRKKSHVRRGHRQKALAVRIVEIKVA